MTNEMASQEFQLLDIYSEDGVRTEKAQARIHGIATVSAGMREGTSLKRSTDGTIFVHDKDNRAPNLQKILDESPKMLKIAFPFDGLNQIIQQRFARYSASRVEAYGDASGITEISKDGERTFHERGTERFKELKATCKVQTTLYFALAEWVDTEHGWASEVSFPDGLGLYRLRTTSNMAADGFLSTLKAVMNFTGGRIAGIPMELWIEQVETMDAKSQRRVVPVWRLRFNPPFTLSTRTMRTALEQGLKGISDMHILPPLQETVEAAQIEALDFITNDDEGSQAQDASFKRATSGRRYDDLLAPWFAAVRGTPLGSDQGRAEFISDITGGQFDSLKAMMEYGEETGDDPTETFNMLMEKTRERLQQIHAEGEGARRLAALKERDANLENYGEGVTNKHIEFLQETVAKAVNSAVGMNYEQRLDFISYFAYRPLDQWVTQNNQITVADMEKLRDLVFESRNGRVVRRPQAYMEEHMKLFQAFMADEQTIAHLAL